MYTSTANLHLIFKYTPLLEKMCVHDDPCPSSEVCLLLFWEEDDWFLELYWDLLGDHMKNNYLTGIKKDLIEKK